METTSLWFEYQTSSLFRSLLRYQYKIINSTTQFLIPQFTLTYLHSSWNNKNSSLFLCCGFTEKRDQFSLGFFQLFFKLLCQGQNKHVDNDCIIWVVFSSLKHKNVQMWVWEVTYFLHFSNNFILCFSAAGMSVFLQYQNMNLNSQQFFE